MNAIKNIFKKQIDDVTHRKFIRFGKGTYERFLINIKNSKNLKVKTSWDWANDLFNLIAKNVKEDVELKGIIVAARDFESELPIEPAEFTKRGKKYKATFNTTASPSDLKKLYETFCMDFILLNVQNSNFKLKCKTSVPKPGGKLKDNFCQATFPKELLSEFVWETEDFKDAKIKHIFNIDNIEIPEEFKNNAKKAREEALRVGTLERVADFDGKEKVEKVNFKL